jgi:hypothetical protein
MKLTESMLRKMIMVEMGAIGAGENKFSPFFGGSDETDEDEYNEEAVMQAEQARNVALDSLVNAQMKMDAARGFDPNNVAAEELKDKLMQILQQQ